MDIKMPHYYEFGEYRIDLAERELQRSGQPIQLTLKAFEVLLALVENHGRIIDKDSLLESIWPDSFVEESNLARNVSTLRQTLGDSRDQPRYIETIAKRGYRFVGEVKTIFDAKAELKDGVEMQSADKKSIAVPKEKIEPVGGAVPLESNFYIVRPVDEYLRAAVARRDTIVLVKGARQMGKTSLLARGLQQAREAGGKVVMTDLQALSALDFESSEKLLFALGNMLADQLDLDVYPDQTWNPRRSPNVNFERFLRKEALGKLLIPIVWGLDEVDRLFSCEFGGEIFGLFRSWHNMRSLDPAGPWRYLTLAITYATEAHLFIKDPNQSPFNVGTQLQLEDFTIEQVAELNRRYGSPLSNETELYRFYALVGGHPYLVRRGFYEMAHGMEYEEFEAVSDRDDGPLGNHLRRMYGTIAKDSELCDAMQGILEGKPVLSAEIFYKLRSAGLIAGDSSVEAKPRCLLYAHYLKRHF